MPGRAARLLPALGLLALLAASETPAIAATLRVEPVRAPRDAARPAVGPAPRGALMRPGEQAIQAERLQAWRRFPDVIRRGPAPEPWAAGWFGRPKRGGLRPGPRAAWPARLTALTPPETLHVAFIRIDFNSDRGGGNSTGDGRFDLSGPDTTLPPIDRAPHNRTFFSKHLEALSRYYWFASYQRVVIVGDVWPSQENQSYHVGDMADLGPWKFSRDIYPAAAHMFHAFATAADTQAIQRGEPIPWDRYTNFFGENGAVIKGGVYFIHAGSDLQSDVRQDSPEDIPTFTLTVADTDSVAFRAPDPLQPSVRPGGLFRCMFVPESATQDGYYGTLNGVIAHESGHLLFGFDDVYNISNGYPVVGFWSLMDSGNLVGSKVLLPDSTELFATGLLPPSIDPFQRFYCTDALSFPEPADGDTVSLHASERFPDMRRVTLTGDEYLLLENRVLAPTDVVELDQDSVTRVVLGPKTPDRFEYDALTPGPGTLVWHIDESVLPFFDTSMRLNPDFGVNTNPNRLGISVIEADGLADLGDPGSPFILGSYYDPFFLANNAVLSDTTHPNLVPNIHTRPHMRLDFLDNPGDSMRFVLRRLWTLPGWPRHADVPPGGPQLLAVDADGDRSLEVCWAGGDSASGDSAGLFAVRYDGAPLDVADTSLAFAHLDHRPRPVMAALPLDETGPFGPSWFAATTFDTGPDTTTAGGRVWLVDHHGAALPGWPAAFLPAVTTPPVIFGAYPNAAVVVGCADQRVRVIGLDGGVLATSDPLGGAVRGRLAVMGTITSPQTFTLNVAAGTEAGSWSTVVLCNPCPVPATTVTTLSVTGAAQGFAPEFLWLGFDGATPRTADATCGGAAALIGHFADRLWAWCPGQGLLWDRRAGDTLVDGLGAGDPDGDGFPDVLTQTQHSAVGFTSVTGYPLAGWPKRGTPEDFVTASPPLALDVDGDGRPEVVALNASGIVAALRGDGRRPAGWPLSSGAGAKGSPVAADLDRDGSLDLVVPDRSARLFAYSLPASGGTPTASPWTMLGGDPGRTCWLSPARTSVAPGPAAGPLVKGSLKAFPNPARQRPVAFTFTVTEPTDIELRVFDASGHQVATQAQHGLYGVENRLIWDTSGVPAGLYMARLNFRAGGREQNEVMPVGVLR